MKSFAADTAAQTGRGQSSVARDITRGTKVVVLADIVGTSLDQGAELDALAKLPEDEQYKLAVRAKRGDKVSAKIRLKQVKRAAREKELGAKQLALPTKKYGASVSDWGWKDDAWSEETGTDRNPDYTTLPSNDPQEIIAVIKPIYDAVCAPDHVHFMCTTIHHLAIAIHVLEDLGFEYKSHVVWKKPKAGLGRWFHSRHEVLLVGTRGNVVCPAPGEQWESVIEAEPAVKGLHSSKPERFFEMIEAYFPTVPKIELNRRGPPRPGWDAFGNEVEVDCPDGADAGDEVER